MIKSPKKKKQAPVTFTAEERLMNFQKKFVGKNLKYRAVVKDFENPKEVNGETRYPAREILENVRFETIEEFRAFLDQAKIDGSRGFLIYARYGKGGVLDTDVYTVRMTGWKLLRLDSELMNLGFFMFHDVRNNMCTPIFNVKNPPSIWFNNAKMKPIFPATMEVQEFCGFYEVDLPEIVSYLKRAQKPSCPTLNN